MLLTEVAVPAGHRQKSPGVEKARTADEAVGEGLGQSVIPAADIAHGGEAAVERVPQHARRVGRSVRLAMGLDLLHADVRTVGMHVRIDQAGHQCPAADVDDARPGRSYGAIRHFADRAVFDQKVHARGAVGVHPVEHTGVAEKNLGHDGRSPVFIAVSVMPA